MQSNLLELSLLIYESPSPPVGVTLPALPHNRIIDRARFLLLRDPPPPPTTPTHFSSPPPTPRAGIPTDEAPGFPSPAYFSSIGGVGQHVEAFFPLLQRLPPSSPFRQGSLSLALSTSIQSVLPVFLNYDLSRLTDPDKVILFFLKECSLARIF